jgi:hypothetical protein
MELPYYRILAGSMGGVTKDLGGGQQALPSYPDQQY